MLAFVDGREADFDSLYGLKFLFWETKGIRSRFASDGETRVLMQKVEAAVERTLYEREKETIPDLVATCAAWARTQNAKRVTKANIEYFLTDRAISLSRGSRDALYNETNFALAKPAN